MQHSIRINRRGQTALELIMSLSLTLSLFGIVVPFLRVQTRGVQANARRSDAQQTARYSQNLIDRELRNIGIGVQPAAPAFGVTRNQPKIVQADTFAVTFNADLVTRIVGDVGAVYYDANVDSLLSSAMPLARRVQLPTSATIYPDFTYVKSDGSPSGAEMVSYWVSRDSTSSYSDEYVLWRRVNDGPINVVSRGIRIPAGQPFFTYWRVTNTGQLQTVPKASLPLYWNSASGIADSIRSVDITVRGVYRSRTLHGDTTTIERIVTGRTGLMNMALAGRGTCGDLPLPARAPAVGYVPTGGQYVHFSWTASIDETGGEKDVERYAIYKRLAGTATWREPFAMAGKGATSFDDFEIATGLNQDWEYGISAQDCSPNDSPIVFSTVHVP